ncbi:hypothetical protein [Patulibacter sp. SYSU D01012]|uniref:hypothetical protein n=1 Tax=Patulibacter sp. SYSU D01012 TaxID=2817381 RepID=UPI001B3079C0|nr:hypothetical protein [Patulibacter sp. SYSU D01012]
MPGPDERAPTVALAPTGAGPRSASPSVPAWELVLDAVAAAWPRVSVVLLGDPAASDPRGAGLAPGELRWLCAHSSVPYDRTDAPAAEQRAALAGAAALLSPSPAAGAVAATLGVPWVPVGDAGASGPPVDEGPDGPRAPGMTRARVAAGVPRVVEALAARLGAPAPGRRRP